MSRVEFVNATGGTMLVDESRIEEYKAAGYTLAADIVDSVAVVVEEKPVQKRRKKKEEV